MSKSNKRSDLIVSQFKNNVIQPFRKIDNIDRAVQLSEIILGNSFAIAPALGFIFHAPFLAVLYLSFFGSLLSVVKATNWSRRVREWNKRIADYDEADDEVRLQLIDHEADRIIGRVEEIVGMEMPTSLSESLRDFVCKSVVTGIDYARLSRNIDFVYIRFPRW